MSDDLLHALGVSKRKVTDPRLQMLTALGGVDHGSTDPRVAPPPTNPPQPTGAAGTTNPLIALQHLYARWQQVSGRRQDPFASRLGHLAPDVGQGNEGNVSLLSAGQQTTHGANAGLMAQRYDLGNGQKENVYYDSKGRRRVMKF
jgi:hypothetical protein